jgi:Tol biopolymer transport system component
VPASGSVAWSPDGSKIAFGRNEDRARSVLVIVDLRDGRLTTIAGSNRDGLNWNQVGAIAWSPDSRTVAFDNDRIGPGPMTTNPVGGPSQDAYLMIVNADGTGLHEIDRRPMGGCCIVGAFLGYLEWSPNGDLIAWGYHGGIVLAPADGSGVRRTVDGFVFYDWSPNGDRLVVVGEGPPIPGSPTMCQGDPNLPPQPCSTNSASIFTMRPDGTDRTWIADGSYPTWLPAAW